MGIRGFFDNARREASSLAHGAVPGAKALLQGGVDDLYQVAGSDTRRANGRFQLDDLFRTGAQEFVRQTPLIPFIKGDFKEAGHRFYERPISGTLDFLGAGSAANQGLKLTSKMPGVIGTSSHKLRGFQQLDPDSLGMGTTLGELPAQIRLADGTAVPSREYLLRPEVELTPNGLFARRTMRSPRATGDARFDEQLNQAGTLAEDHLINQSVPRARYEPFAKLGDAFDFGPKIGSSRFGKRLAIKNRSRLKISSQEMMALLGRNRKLYRKTFGEDADGHVGDATFIASFGIKNSSELDELAARLVTPSGQKAVITKDGVDLATNKGEVFELTVPELDVTTKYIAQRDEMAEQLAKDIERLNNQGKAVVHTGTSKPTILTPEMVRGDKEAAYRLMGFGNLHVKRIDPIIEPKRPYEQGGLFDPPAPVKPQDAGESLPEPSKVNTDQGRLFTEPTTKTRNTDSFEWVNGEPKYKDPDTGEWIDIQSQHRAFPSNPTGDHVDGTQGSNARRAEFWDGWDREEIPVTESLKAKETASDAEVQLVHDATEPIQEMIDELLDDVIKTGEPVTPGLLNTWMDLGSELFRNMAPDLFEKVGQHGVEGAIYRRILDSLEEKGVSRHNAEVDTPHVEIETEPIPVGDAGDFPPVKREPNLLDDDDPSEVRDLRRRTSENYAKASWYKNYLDHLAQARLSNDFDIIQRVHQIAKNPRVREILDSELFSSDILPSHQTLLAAQLEADRVRLGANALSNQAVARNTDRLSILAGKEGEGLFFVARKPRSAPKDPAKRIQAEEKLALDDDGNAGDPAELIARGVVDTNPTVHLSNYLRRKREAANQELFDTAIDSSVLVDKGEAKARVQQGEAMWEDDFHSSGSRKRDFVILRPNGALYQKIAAQQPLANTAARRLAEDGFHQEAANIKRAADEMFEASKDGDFSLGDMIRNPKLRGEPDDSHYMIPTDMYQSILNEVTESTSALSSFLQTSSTAFKISVLHGRWPGWVVNNTIGSQIYLAMTGGLGSTIPHVGGAKLVKDYFPDVLGSGSREMATGAEDLGRVATSRVEKVLDSPAGKKGRELVDVLSDLNQKIADEPARIVRIEQVIEERFQQAQTLAKARGLEIPDTLESRRRLLMDQKVREDIAQEVLDDMIDFTTLSKSERMWLSNAFPFWTFIKGSTKSTFRTMADHPGRMWAPAQVANFGSERTDEEFPTGTPEYLRAMLRIGDDQALSVGGWNPYGQQAQMMGGLLSMLNSERPTGQEHPLAMVNPIFTAPVEATTNRDFYTDYPLSGNLLQNLGSSAWESFPLGQTLASILSPKPPTGRSVFRPSRETSLLNAIGVPIRELDEGNLSTRLAQDENRRHSVVDYWRFHDGV